MRSHSSIFVLMAVTAIKAMVVIRQEHITKPPAMIIINSRDVLWGQKSNYEYIPEFRFRVPFRPCPLGQRRTPKGVCRRVMSPYSKATQFDTRRQNSKTLYPKQSHDLIPQQGTSGFHPPHKRDHTTSSPEDLKERKEVTEIMEKAWVPTLSYIITGPYRSCPKGQRRTPKGHCVKVFN